jgi:hypothetical protein
MLASGSAFVGTDAFAGAWVHEPGKGQTINNVARETGEFGETWRSDMLSEFGIYKGWGGRLKIEDQIRLDEDVDDRFSAEIGLQRSFAWGPRGALSVSASVLMAEALEGPQCEGTGYETRIGAGQSFAFGERTAFVNVETAWRERGGCGRFVTEAAVGMDLGWSFRAIGKVYGEQGDGARSLKAEAMLLYDMDGYSAGFGYRRELSGAFEEEGWVATIWSRF